MKVLFLLIILMSGSFSFAAYLPNNYKIETEVPLGTWTGFGVSAARVTKLYKKDGETIQARVLVNANVNGNLCDWEDLAVSYLAGRMITDVRYSPVRDVKRRPGNFACTEEIRVSPVRLNLFVTAEANDQVQVFTYDFGDSIDVGMKSFKKLIVIYDPGKGWATKLEN